MSKYEPQQLWILLTDSHDRDGYGLKPFKWEGPGEYQRFARGDELGVLVKVPASADTLRELGEL